LLLSFLAIEFDDTSGLSSKRLTSFGGGDNTVFTATGPCFILDGTLGTKNQGLTGTLNFMNGTGGSVAYVSKYQPSGSSAIRLVGANASTLARVAPTTAFAMASGDSIILNTASSSSLQFAWINVVET
jgi:hypothetical protein